MATEQRLFYKVATLSIVQETIGDETFTSFSLKNSKNEEIAETTLGVGCLAYLANLKINGTQIDL